MTASTASFREGVEAQPQNLQQGAELLQGALADADLSPLREGTIVFSGIGASWHALLPAVRTLRADGRRAFAVAASELARAPALADAYVVVSQSGASAEILEALARLEGRPVYTVSAHGDSPLAGAGTWLPLGPLPDTAVSTLAYTATLQALGLICEAIQGSRRHADWTALPGHVRAAIDMHDDPAAAFAERLAAVSAIDAVGGGASAASAGETTLLVREALRLAAFGAETREYLHGPLEAVAEDFGCILFGAARELELAAALASFGAVVCVIGDRVADASGVHTFRLPPLIEPARVVLEIVPVQLLVLHGAAARGLSVQALRREQPDTKARVG